MMIDMGSLAACKKRAISQIEPFSQKKVALFKPWKSKQTCSAGQGLSHMDICIWVIISASGGTREISDELKQILHSNPWESRYRFHTVLWGAAGAVWGPRRDLHEMHDSAQGPRGDYRPRQSDGCESCNMFCILTRHWGRKWEGLKEKPWR